MRATADELFGRLLHRNNKQFMGAQYPDDTHIHYTRTQYAGVLVPINLIQEKDEVMKAILEENFVDYLYRPEYFHLVNEYVHSRQFRQLSQSSESRPSTTCSYLENDAPIDEAYSNDFASSNTRRLETTSDQIPTLKPASEVATPESVDQFFGLIPQCMSDTQDDKPSSSDTVRIFSAKSAKQLAEGTPETEEGIKQSWRMFVSMARSNGHRRTINRNESLELRLKGLRDEFPNFRHVVNHIIKQMQVWSIKRDEDRRLKPILLNGSPGCGKSAFARALADAFETHYEYVNIAALSMGATLTGTSSKWRSGQAGTIFSALANSETASPLILLDEIEKAGKFDQFPIEGPLLALLEPQTSCEFRDEYANFAMDASRIIYLATSNDESLIPAPLKSRFDIFNIEAPDFEQRKAIACNMVKKSYVNIRFSECAMSLICEQEGDLRFLKTLLDKVVGQHIEILLSNMNSIERITPDRSGESQDTQIIDEETVQLCLQDSGKKIDFHFGFVELKS